MVELCLTMFLACRFLKNANLKQNKNQLIKATISDQSYGLMKDQLVNLVQIPKIFCIAEIALARIVNLIGPLIKTKRKTNHHRPLIRPKEKTHSIPKHYQMYYL